MHGGENKYHIPGTAAVVVYDNSLLSSQLFDMMRAVAGTGTHIRGHFPTTPTLTINSHTVALARNNITSSAFSCTRAFNYKLQTLVRNNIPTRAFSHSAFSQDDINQYFHVTKPLEAELVPVLMYEADTSPHPQH